MFRTGKSVNVTTRCPVPNMVSFVRGRTAGRTLSDAEIVRLYVAGEDSTTVAFKANCDSTTVLNLVRQAGETVRRSGGRRTTNKLKLTEAEICRRYFAGESGPTLADAAGTSPSTIYGVLKRGGVQRRAATVSATAAATFARKRGTRGPTS